MSPSTSKESGFTLLEVLIAFSILAVGILGLGAMLTQSMNSETKSAEMRNADRLIMKVSETIKNWPSDNIASLNGSVWPRDMPTGALGDEPWGGSPVMQFQVSEKQAPTTELPGVYLLTLNVFWGGSACSSTDPTKCSYRTSTTTVILARQGSS